MASILVLGAGMVGTSTALALLKRGHEVVLVDRREPGAETSYGNAGIIQTEAAEPYGMPRDPATILAILLGRSFDVTWHAGAVLRAAPNLLRYYFHSAPRRHRATAAVYSRLTRRAVEDHAPLVEESGAGNLLRQMGFLAVYRTAQELERAEADAERLRRDWDVPSAVLDGGRLASAEPGLRRRLAGAIHWTGPWTCSSPGDLVKAYASLLSNLGGQVQRGDARMLEPTATGWRCITAGGTVDAEHAVVALGPWSGELLRRFDYRMPMVLKRGYHQHVACEAGPLLPMLDAERGAVYTMMKNGLRICTAAELTHPSAPVFRRQIDVARQAAAELFSLGRPVDAEPWFGHRPCMVDMLPVVGAMPRHRGLWANFGHGHQGFTLGPTTAALLADQIGGALPDEIGRPLNYRW